MITASDDTHGSKWHMARWIFFVYFCFFLFYAEPNYRKTIGKSILSTTSVATTGFGWHMARWIFVFVCVLVFLFQIREMYHIDCDTTLTVTPR